MSSHIRRALIGLVALAVVASACSGDSAGSDAADAGADGLRIAALSTRAEYVTGGDVLVELTGDDGADLTSATFTVDGEDAEATVYEDQAGRTVALVTGLPSGDAEIEASVGDATAALVVTDHDPSGPLFSGPQLPMPVCTTDLYGLAPSTPEDGCFAEPAVTWQYRDADGGVHDLADPSTIPEDVAVIEDGPNAGRPLVTRTERGVLNRGIYEITVLDPAPAPDAAGTQGWDRTTWNGRLVYRFGGGCGVTYTQGFFLMGDPETALLAQGYAFASSTLNTYQVACNDIVSAETALMVKEHFSEAYAPPTFTIGNGGSGGSIQQYLVAQNYPGILDAITATVPFPDAVSIAPGVVDCVLLNAYYGTEGGAALRPEQRTAVNGHATPLTCTTWETTFARNLRPDDGCSLAILEAAGAAAGGGRGGLSGIPEGGLPELPASAQWSEDQPEGLRCTLQDGNVNVLGRDPATGFASRPLDNVGVQYGLEALRSGTIDVDEFLDLNRSIGGADIDGGLVPERMAADPDTVTAVYGAGGVTQGGPLLDIPIITVDIYTDDQGDIHDRFRAFTIRDRLERAAGGDAPGYVIWTRGLPEGKSLVDSLTGAVDLDDLVPTADEWLTALAADDAEGTRAEQLERTRPPDAGDHCVSADGERIAGDDVYDETGGCTARFAIHGDPRTAAGEPRVNDIVKCELQPVADAVEAGVHGVALSSEQVAELEAVFPEGVCDYGQPGIGWAMPAEPWQRVGGLVGAPRPARRRPTQYQ